MPSSNTYNFSTSTQVAQMITEAFERIGFFGEAVSGDMLTSAMNTFNYMLMSWTSDQSKQWAINTLQQHTCVPGDATFTLGVGEYDILDMAVRYNGIDIGMAQISRDEYLLVSQKTVSSQPVNYFVDKSTYPVTVYLYPVPNSTLQILLYNASKLPQDINDPSFLAGVTPWWIEGMTAGLSARLAEKFKPEIYDVKLAIAEDQYKKSRRADIDQTDARIRTPYKFG